LIDENDRGFLLGDGVFETCLVANRVALWLDEHLTRMKKSSRKMDLPFDREAVEKSIAALLSAGTDVMQVLRVTLTRGATARGLAADCVLPTLHVALTPFDADLMGQDIALVTSSLRRNPSSVSDRHKTTSYANNIFAAREAKAKGADDALMLNQDGLVACTTIGNVFMLSDGKLVTPPEQDGVLPGIMRRFLIDQFSAEVRSFDRDELEDADGLFVTNSLRLISNVVRLDGQVLPKTDTKRFMDAVLSAAKVQCGILLKET
jgi:branched-chain amino acid aminotransferase